MRSWWPPGEERATDGALFPLEVAGSRQGGPELLGRKYGAALEEQGDHHGREEQPMVYLPQGGDWQPSGRLGAARGIWRPMWELAAAREGESSRRCPSSP